MNKIKFKYGINEKPNTKAEHIILSLQHVFAMFGSTILVPTLIGIDVSTALFTAGLGTLIYLTVTKNKVPVFIGSSFAYIALLSLLNAEQGPAGVAMAVMTVGVIYALIAFIIGKIGTMWLDKVLPPIVIGPVIIIIGLGLAPTAVANAGLLPGSDNYNMYNVVVAFVALLSATYALLLNNKKLNAIPIIFGIFMGYISALLIDAIFAQDLVDTSLIMANGLISIPSFNIPGITYDFSFNLGIIISVIPLVLVTISEHIGDHSVSSSMLDEDFLHDPGLNKTLLGDGLATLCAGLLGGPVNTTYAENTGVIMLTRVASVSVIKLAAIFAMCLAFISPVVGFINSIPVSVMGGISILLFGMIAQNGIKILVTSNIDFAHPRNLVMMAVILVLGLGGASIGFSLGDFDFTFTGMALSIIIGVLFHLILPEKNVAYGNKKVHIKDM